MRGVAIRRGLEGRSRAAKRGRGQAARSGRTPGAGQYARHVEPLRVVRPLHGLFDFLPNRERVSSRVALGEPAVPVVDPDADWLPAEFSSDHQIQVPITINVPGSNV